MKTSAPTNFLAWTECLLDSARSPGEHRQAANDWCAWALAILGIDENRSWDGRSGFFAETVLDAGKAISPLAAARCVREFRRTAVFLQAVEAAIQAVRERFPGETIHLLEAGCGPLAPLALPFALRYTPDEVQFTLLDLHAASLEGVKRLVEELGVAASVRGYLEADATTVRFAEADRPHIIACEVLLRALRSEPQVMATMNLAPQLRPGGFFLPERIEIAAGILDEATRFAAAIAAPDENGRRATGIEELGPVFTLEAATAHARRKIGPDRYAAESVRVPPHRHGRFQLFTRIDVFRGRTLGDYECSLNLPTRLDYPRELAERGGLAEFSYEISSDPGLRLTATPLATGKSAPQPGLDGMGGAVR